MPTPSPIRVAHRHLASDWKVTRLWYRQDLPIEYRKGDNPILRVQQNTKGTWYIEWAMVNTVYRDEFAAMAAAEKLARSWPKDAQEWLDEATDDYLVHPGSYPKPWEKWAAAAQAAIDRKDPTGFHKVKFEVVVATRHW